MSFLARNVLKLFISGSFTAVHRTEVIKNTLNPTWKSFTVLSRAMCNGDYDRYNIKLSKTELYC